MRTTQVVSILALSTLLTAGCGGATADAPYGMGNPYGSVSEAPGAGSAGGPAANGGSAGNSAGSVSQSMQGGVNTSTADVVLTNGAAFQAYLADAAGRALYMFANDTPGSSSSTCTEACLDKWPVFDAKDLEVGTGLTLSDFGRFLRADGSWQTTFKGHPLYRFAMDSAAGAVSGDAVGGRWFVARDYLAFVASKANLTPQGATAPAPYMTNRMGRTVYVFMNDTAGSNSIPPASACVDKCLDAWPIWNAPATLGSLMLPSSMKAADFGEFTRSVGGAQIKQLTYRGWPLYFHTPDVAPGETTGHLSGAWRAIDPKSFVGPGATTM
jgi:predicted lipoprotein with Yx(FWY)xxD motif